MADDRNPTISLKSCFERLEERHINLRKQFESTTSGPASQHILDFIRAARKDAPKIAAREDREELRQILLIWFMELERRGHSLRNIVFDIDSPELRPKIITTREQLRRHQGPPKNK